MPPSPTRAQRQAQNGAPRRSGGTRWGLVAILAVLGVVVVAAAAFFLLRKDSTENAGPQFKASTAVDLQPGAPTIAAVDALIIAIPPEVTDGVLATLRKYVDAAIVAPLRTGKADDAALAAVFDAPAVARLGGPERSVVLDEGLPKAIGRVSVTTPPVPITALADRDEKFVLVTAGVQFDVKARARKGVVQITRSGSFVLALDEAGEWKITGWTLTTDRGGPGVTPAPAASETTTTVAP